MTTLKRWPAAGATATLAVAALAASLGAAPAMAANHRPTADHRPAANHRPSAHHRPAQKARANRGLSSATLYVSTTGSDVGNCDTLATACATIGYALGQASTGDRVLVEPGTYVESDNPGGAQNVISPNLNEVTLAADRAHGATAANTVIDATGENQGVVVQAKRGAVDGLTVENAQLEGILVEPTPSSWPATATAPAANVTQVTIKGNVVENNDKAFDRSDPDQQTGCLASPTDADDCGEGIHLLAATDTHVIGNTVTGNVGGVLISDGGLAPTSVGPAAHNLVEYNSITDNPIACGVTLPSHDPRAVSAQGTPQPSLAGVYDNRIEHNLSERNGGSGILDAAPYPGTGSYDNTFSENYIADNAHGGVQLHSHAAQQDVNGNRVIGNYIATNNLTGDTDSGDLSTTGIILFSGVDPVTGTRIFDNVITGDSFGIWKTSNVAAHRFGLNLFSDNGANVFTQQ